LIVDPAIAATIASIEHIAEPATNNERRIQDVKWGPGNAIYRMLLARIEHLNPELNAVVVIDADGARASARAADDTPAARRGPLHGLPMTFKDVWEVSDMTASCGLPELKLHRPLRDADAVARLRRAGVIPFGKTNVPTLIRGREKEK
jgi:Asp-tRNA(Asn)/Glu-tRNA(Gln) amidotransferase A subunit family amidase